MKIQQHDGVVVEATVISAGLRQAQGEGGVDLHTLVDRAWKRSRERG